MLAAAVGLVLWPVTRVATWRTFWAHRTRRPGDAVTDAALRPVPQVPVAPGDRLGRILVSGVGALALLVICGSQEITALLTSGIGSASAGSRSAWLLLQLAVLLVLIALMIPAMWATDRMLRRVERDDPRRRALELRQDWYLAAVTAWTACLLIGYLFAYLVLTRL